MGVLSLVILIFSEVTGGSIYSDDPQDVDVPGYPVILRDGPGTFWEAMLSFSIFTVILGVIGWLFFGWAERREAEQEEFDGLVLGMLEETRQRLNDPEFLEGRMKAFEETFVGMSLDEKIEWRNELVENPGLYDDLIERADEILSEEFDLKDP